MGPERPRGIAAGESGSALLGGVRSHARKGDLMPLMQCTEQMESPQVTSTSEWMKGAGFHPKDAHEVRNAELLSR